MHERKVDKKEKVGSHVSNFEVQEQLILVFGILACSEGAFSREKALI